MRNLVTPIVLSALMFAAACSEPEPAAPAPPASETPAPTPETPTTPAGNVLSAEGLGPVRVGMTEAEVVALWGAASGHMTETGTCQILNFAQAPAGVLVMFNDGKVGRISLTKNATFDTDRGLGLGDQAAEVKRVYGAALQSQPHKYQEAPAEDLFVWNGGPRTEPYVEDAAARGVRYEVGSDGKVMAIHAGGPSIQLVEGCF